MRVLTAAFFALALVFTAPAHAADGLVVKESPYGVAKTADRLEAVLKSKGITVFARVNHAGGAKKVGLELQPTQLLIFGNPKLGTPLMKNQRSVGIDLPLKALIWREKGKVWLAYNDPAYLVGRHGLTKPKVIEKMTKALNGLTNAAIKKD